MESEDTTHERYGVEDPSVLLEDTWADEPVEALVCERCGAGIESPRFRCGECGAPLPTCVGSCGACVSPRCVGGKRS